MPLCLLAMGGIVPFWLSSMDNRRAVLLSFDHGISTNLIECGSVFCCVDEDGAKISDKDVGDSMDLTDVLSILTR